MNVRQLNKRAGLAVQRVVTLVLLVVLLYGDVSAILQFSPLPSIPIAQAATGDFSIFREVTGTNIVPLDTDPPEIVTWDTTVSESSNIALQGDNGSINLADGGKYLVLYNFWSEEGTSTSPGTNRRSIHSWLDLEGSPLGYGHGSGYIRDSDNTLYAYNASGAIIEANAGDDLSVMTKRDDTNSSAGVNVRSSSNGVSVLKLNDSWDYLRVQRSATTTDIDGNTSFTDVTWDTDDEVSTSSFEFTPTSGDVTLKGPAGKHYLVTANVKLNRTSNSQRLNYEMRLSLDGSELPGTVVTSYMRGSNNGNGHFNGTLVYTGIIQKTSSSDQTLNVEYRRESTSVGGSTYIVGEQTGLSMVALPDEGSYVMLTNSSSTRMASGREAMEWDTQAEVDSYAFSHSTSVNPEQINIDQSGDYLFFSTMYATTSGDDNDRQTFRIDWRKNGTDVLAYGSHGNFIRDDTTFAGGSSGGAILNGLVDSDFIEVTQFDETEAPPSAGFRSNRMAVQGILLDDNFFGTDVYVTATGTQTVQTEIPVQDFYAGGSFIIQEQSSNRNVTGITITESGTVDAQTGLDNIELYYDLDTSFPYDCSSESFSATTTESKFGDTDTNGFNGANGVSTFTGSVEITTTKAMCVYVVYDVTASAADSETVELSIDDPKSDVTANNNPSIGPVQSADIDGTTTFASPELTQIHYHWREDDGSQTAASSVEGSQDTAAGGFQAGVARRLRVEVSVEGSATSSPVQYRLQYAEKAGTCEAVSSWIDVAETGGDWDVFDSPNVTNEGNTTDIAEANGGVSNEEDDFYGTNAQVDGGDKSTSITLGPTEFVELEYTLTPTSAAAEGSTYCFRLVDEAPDVTHSYRLPITVQSSQIDSTLSDFPVYVDLADLGSHFFANVQSDGGDIRVTAADGSTELPREVVSINTGASTGELHFEADSVSSSTDTTFYIYYGSTDEDEYQSDSIYGSESVWGNGFEAVYHLPTTADSTGNDYTLSESNISSVTNSRVGSQAADFNGSTSVYSNTDLDSALNGLGGIAFSAWVQSDVTNTDKGFMIVPAIDGSDQDFSVRYDAAGANGGGSNLLKGSIDTTAGPMQYETNDNTQTTSWQHVAHTWQSGQAIEVSLDGSLVTFTDTPTSQSGTTAIGAGTLYLGASAKDSTSGGWDGRMDEVRFSNIYRSRYWVASEYNNQNLPTSFYSTSSYESLVNNQASIAYSVYPEANITADITVSASSTQVATLDADDTSQHVGGTFVIERAGTDRTITDITITATGTVDATSLTNPTLYYEVDTAAPEDCTGETYDGDESNVAGSAFSGPNGDTTFSFTQVVNSSQAFCGYLVVDVGTTTINGQTVEFQITDPSVDVVVATSTVGPSTAISPTGSSTIAGPVLTQQNYHWRNDNGDETGATSATGDSQNTAVTDVPRHTPYRLRLGITNDGTVISNSATYRLEYGTKFTSCEEVGSWNEVSNGEAFVMASTSQLVDGNDTTDVGTTTAGGVDNPSGKSFVTPNGGQAELDAETASVVLDSDEFTELEYAIEVSALAGYDTQYCFRLTDGGTEIVNLNYPELTTREQQDFFVQRGTEVVSGTSTTLIAGTDYTAPVSTSSAFVRITTSQITGAGDLDGGTQNPKDVTAYIGDQSDITSSFTISRPVTAISNTRVDWEILEYVGLPGADNEMIVRDVNEVSYSTSELHATGTVVSSIEDNGDLVIFITGQTNENTSANNYHAGISTAFWHSTSGVPVFTRETVGSTSAAAAEVSYAVVEFVGLNWKVQRVEHQYEFDATAETEDIAPVGSLSRAFVHAQRRGGDEKDNGLNDYGHLVWLSSLGAVSFEIESGTQRPSDHYSVAWVIENTQAGDGSMAVYRDADLVDGTGSSGRITVFDFGGPVNNLSNTSLWITNGSTGDGTAFPRTMLGAIATSTSQYEIFESDVGQTQNFHVAMVQWPVAELAFVQRSYRFYVDNDLLLPTDPWPVGGAKDLGENTSITGADEPLGEGERVRIRMTVGINNASLPAETATFKLQYGRRDGESCSAISSWNDIGDPGSGEIWRGYNATPVDGTTLATTTLVITSDSSTAGTYEEANDSAANPYSANVGDDVEYDWLIEHNGAQQISTYCFRMVEADGSNLVSYENYPTLRTTGYTPVVTDWRWYDDEQSETPTTALAAENVAPTDIGNQDIIKLRVVAAEVEGAPGSNVKFALQYAQQPSFIDAISVAASSSCGVTSTWCYAEGAGIDNVAISTTTITSADSCVAGVGDGCGTHNETSSDPSTHAQPSLSNMEFEFTIQQRAAVVNTLYYFRLYDVTNDTVVYASSSYPTLVTEGASLIFTVDGLPSGTTTEGVVTDATTTPSGVSFGALPIDTEYSAAHRLSVETNATEGYQVLLFARQGMRNGYGTEIENVLGTNLSPLSWTNGCLASADGCFGYHAGDDTLSGGSARFAPTDTYAGVDTSLQEIMYSSIPTSESRDIVYRLQVTNEQEAGDYETDLLYVAIPHF